MKKLIPSDKSVILAADVPTILELESLVGAVAPVSGISGVKLGIATGSQGLARATGVVRRKAPNMKVIYDHQKAGNDIPAMGMPFAEVVRDAGVDAVILFPFTGPATQTAWTKACFACGLHVIVGGEMTHPDFLADAGGYIDVNAPEKIYRRACQEGVVDFVVPGTKVKSVEKIRNWLVQELGEGNFTLYAPGFITQGGDISDCGRAAGEKFHAIVGSAIYNKKTPEERRQAAIAVTRQLVPVPA